MDSPNEQAYEQIAEHIGRIHTEMAKNETISTTPSLQCAECGGMTQRAFIAEAPAPYKGMKLIKPLCYTHSRIFIKEQVKNGEHTTLFPRREEV